MEQRFDNSGGRTDPQASVSGEQFAATLARIALRFNSLPQGYQAFASDFEAKLLPQLLKRYGQNPELLESAVEVVITAISKLDSSEKINLVISRLALEVFDQIKNRIFDFNDALHSALSSRDCSVLNRSDPEDLIRIRDTKLTFELAMTKAYDDSASMLEDIQLVYQLHTYLESCSLNSAQEQFICGIVRNEFYDFVQNELHPYVAYLGAGSAYPNKERLLRGLNAVIAILQETKAAVHCSSAQGIFEYAHVKRLMHERGLITKLNISSIEDYSIAVVDGLTPDFHENEVSLEIANNTALVRSPDSSQIWEFVSSPFEVGFTASASAILLQSEEFEGVFLAHADGKDVVLGRGVTFGGNDLDRSDLVFNIPNLYGEILVERKDQTITLLMNGQNVWSGSLEQFRSLQVDVAVGANAHVSSMHLDSHSLQIITPPEGDSKLQRNLRLSLIQALMMLAKSNIGVLRSAIDRVEQISISADKNVANFEQATHDGEVNKVHLGITCTEEHCSSLDIALMIVEGAARNLFNEYQNIQLSQEAKTFESGNSLPIDLDTQERVRISLCDLYCESLKVRFLRSAERQRLVAPAVVEEYADVHRNNLLQIQPVLTLFVSEDAKSFVFELLGRAELMASASKLLSQASSDTLKLRNVDLPVEPIDRDEAATVVRFRDTAVQSNRKRYFSKISKLARVTDAMPVVPAVDSSDLVSTQSTQLALVDEKNIKAVSRASRLLSDYKTLQNKIELERIKKEQSAEIAENAGYNVTAFRTAETIIGAWISEQIIINAGDWDSDAEDSQDYKHLAALAIEIIEGADAQQFSWALEDCLIVHGIQFNQVELEDLIDEIKGSIASLTNQDSKVSLDQEDKRQQITQFFSHLVDLEELNLAIRRVENLVIHAQDPTLSDAEVKRTCEEVVDLVLRKRKPSEVIEHLIHSFWLNKNRDLVHEVNFERLEKNAIEILTIPGRGYLQEGAVYFLQYNPNEILDLCNSVDQLAYDFDNLGSSPDERIAEVRDLWSEVQNLEPADARAACMVLGASVVEEAVLEKLKFELLRVNFSSNSRVGTHSENPSQQLLSVIFSKVFPDTAKGQELLRKQIAETLYNRYLAKLRIGRKDNSSNSLGSQLARIEDELVQIGINPDQVEYAQHFIERGELPPPQDPIQALPEKTDQLGENEEAQ